MISRAFEQPDYDVAICRAGLEPVVESELCELGLEVVFSRNRMVAFRGGDRGFYLANRALRSVIQVLRPVRKFRAKDTDVLYHQIRKTPWPNLFGVGCSLRIDVKGSSPLFPNSQYFVHRVKDAVVDTFRSMEGERPSIAKGDPDVRIVVFVHRDEVTVYLDGSGRPLSERGYRLQPGAAPIKEDLAAGILGLLGWKAGSLFIDPMAGSGTFLAEAWMMDARVAPNRERRMAFQQWSDYRREVDDEVRQCLRAAERESSTRFIGIEVDREAFGAMQNNLSRLLPGGVCLDLRNGEFQGVSDSFDGAFVATNPPYGQRISGEHEALYRELGRFVKTQCGGGLFGVLTGNFELLRWFGMRVDRRWNLFNGQLPVRLCQYRVNDRS